MDSIIVTATITRTISVGDRVRVIGQKFAFDTFYRSGEVQAVGHEEPCGPFVKIAFTGGIVILRGEVNIVTSLVTSLAPGLTNPAGSAQESTASPQMPSRPLPPVNIGAYPTTPGEGEFKIAMLGDEPVPPKGANSEAQRLFQAPAPVDTTEALERIRLEKLAERHREFGTKAPPVAEEQNAAPAEECQKGGRSLAPPNIEAI